MEDIISLDNEVEEEFEKMFIDNQENSLKLEKIEQIIEIVKDNELEEGEVIEESMEKLSPIEGSKGDDQDKVEEDDDDDNVVIRIDLKGTTEQEKLHSLLHLDTYDNGYGGPSKDIPIICNKNYTYHKFDLEIEREVESLVRLSICPSTEKHVVILVNNQLILVPHNVRLSDRLTSYVWGPRKPYVESTIPYAGEFNRLLVPDEKYKETFAVFGARYNNTQYIRDTKNVCGLHQYCEFAAIIVSNHQIIDYAIHGVKSDIETMIRHHAPRRIYYNSKNESLTSFLEYECQPFYGCFKDLLRPVKIHEPLNFNTLPFCERKDIFCALCRCLKDARGFLNYAKVPAMIRIPQRLQRFNPIAQRYVHHNHRQQTCQQRLIFKPNNRCQRHQNSFISFAKLYRDVPSGEYMQLERVRNRVDRYRGQRRKRKMTNFNTNLNF